MSRLLTKKDVSEKVGVSLAQIDRWNFDENYEHLGFPSRVRIGFRVFWVEAEITSWIERQVANYRSSA